MKSYLLITSILICLLVNSYADPVAMAGMRQSKKLLHNTIRISSSRPDGKISTGTGFFYSFASAEPNSGFIPVIVTCWHVVSNSTQVVLNVSESTSNALERVGSSLGLGLSGDQNVWIRHPDTNIDLAVMPIAPILELFEKNGKKWDTLYLSKDLIPPIEELNQFGVFQEVKFLGYPMGEWDQKNNFPIVRRGMTASDPGIDYNGRPQFLIDAAVYPGSSGSPVFIAEDDPVLMGQVGGATFGPPRMKFLGILNAVFIYDSSGNVEVSIIPSAFDIKVTTGVPANIGVVIKASQLDEIRTTLLKFPATRPAPQKAK